MAEKVRSEIFHEIGKLSKEFIDQLNFVWNMTDQKRQIILDNFLSILIARTERRKKVAYEKIIKEIGDSQDTTIKALDVLVFIADSWNPRRDTVDSVIVDFLDINLFPKEESQKIKCKEFLKSFLELVKSDNDRSLNLSTARSLLPCLNNLFTGIDFRVVVESEFDWRKDDPSTYNPIIHRVVPVVILRFKRDEGDPVLFQADREEIESLIRKLQATIKELDSIQISVK